MSCIHARKSHGACFPDGRMATLVAGGRLRHALPLVVCLASLGCGHQVVPGKVSTSYENGVEMIEGSFSLKTALLTNRSKFGGGCLMYAELSQTCVRHSDCEVRAATSYVPGTCAAYAVGSPMVCWHQPRNAQDACKRSPAADLSYGPHPIRTPNPHFIAPGKAVYWRVSACHAFEANSCHQIRPDGSPNYVLRLGPVTTVRGREVLEPGPQSLPSP